MEFDQNRSGKPSSVTPLTVIRALLTAFKQWRARRETAAILSQLNDQQLKDIGMSRSDVERWR
ncbi:DUF1127 domain-containing protein [Candidatus Pantoea multigeneris]|uniref:DUF1127 domain-containing protein n=1 Tax=Candidatus Pantoea multigeneris TaxID=2608357 RepID=A0ABX0RI36_9GAMM|nr:DUF1127 domain-containing protein [Pantoea multigeneris]NIF24702.1 DUF1127 domain-containing protein [Pantoea multigeneris]